MDSIFVQKKTVYTTTIPHLSGRAIIIHSPTPSRLLTRALFISAVLFTVVLLCAGMRVQGRFDTRLLAQAMQRMTSFQRHPCRVLAKFLFSPGWRRVGGPFHASRRSNCVVLFFWDRIDCLVG